MSYKVIGSNPRGSYAFEYEKESLDPLGAEIVIVHYRDDRQFGAAIRDADAVLMNAGFTLTGGLVREMRRCKIIINGGVGVDRIDVEAATEAGIPVVNVPDVWLNEVADHALLLLLAAVRKLPHSLTVTASGGWGEVYTDLGSVPRIQGKTLGLVAFGNIARLVARRALAFGMRVVAFDPLVSADVMREHGVEARSLEDLLREADFVSAHAPHNRHTHHMLSDAQFALMKPTAIFVNTGRGKVVDEAALIRALQSGRIAGAGLDVTEVEPAAKDNPLRSMPNVILTPHVAYYSDEAFIASRRRVGEEVAAVFQGRRPKHVVNPSVLERLSLA
jgi:D-3-phosphoglycerate dehydrogenase / 2-oxoglutarate reductase